LIQALLEAVAAPDIPARKTLAITLLPILSLTGGLEHFKGRRTLWNVLPLTTFHQLWFQAKLEKTNETEEPISLSTDIRRHME
jgi:hypothetical protein